MQVYDSSPTPPSSIIPQDNSLGILSRTAPSSGLFLPSPSSRPFGSPYEEPLELNSLPPTPTKLSPLFVDRITRESNLSKPQHAELQKMLALGTSLGGGLTLPDLATRVFAMASVFSSENRIVALIAAQGMSGTAAISDNGVDIRSLFKELGIRLEETFHFTREQTTNIRRVCQDTIINPKLFRFKELHIEVEKKMRREPDSYRMGNIFGQPAREKAFTATARRTASNVRNAFRQELRDSVMGPTQTSLTIFTVQMAMKYRLGSVISQLDQGYKIHNALLRRFAYEHKILLLNKEEEDDDDLDDEEEDEDPSNTTQPGQQKKRKKKSIRKKVGRISNGDDFWSKVDAWFEEEIRKRDRDLSGPLWRSYVDETIKQDNKRFDSEMAGVDVSSELESPLALASASSRDPTADDVTAAAPSMPATTNGQLSWGSSFSTLNSTLAYGTSEAGLTERRTSESDSWAALMASAEGR